MTATITPADMNLLDLDELRSRLAATEPVTSRPFTVGDHIRFQAAPEAAHGIAAKAGHEPVGVYVGLGAHPGYTGPAFDGLSGQYQLTRNTLEEVAHTAGLPRTYVRDCPPELLVPHLNYWYRQGLHGKRGRKDFQFVINEHATAIAFTRQGLSPFSNLRLLEQTVDLLREKFGPGTEILADPKLHHNLRGTTMRLIVPASSWWVDDSGTLDDRWSLGVQLKNSLTGLTQTSVEGYLFRWICTNGQIDAHAHSGSYTRRAHATEDETYAWAREAVNDALSGLGNAVTAVRNLTQIGIDGSVTDTLRDLFTHYRIPISLRPRIINALETHDGEITMYVIMNAITQAANDPALDPSQVETLMRIGGDLPYTAEQRCGACHRLMHHH